MAREPEPLARERTLTIRPARRGELGAAAHVYLIADDELDARTHGQSLREPPPTHSSEEAEVLADLTLALDESPENVWVAVERDAVVGMAAAIVRERHWQLTYLFVLPAAQRRGIGRLLLAHIHRAGVNAGCDIFTTYPSEDPKALSRYLGLGLFPQPPTVVLQATRPIFPPFPWDDGFEATPLTADDDAVLATVGDLDRAVRGARRPQDLRRWLSEGARGALLTRRETTIPTGYYLVARDGTRGRIGPVVALDEERVAAVVTRALAAAADLALPDIPWRALLPGQNHAALAPLLTAGFRPLRLDPFFASAPLGRFDRYLLHDEDLL